MGTKYVCYVCLKNHNDETDASKTHVEPGALNQAIQNLHWVRWLHDIRNTSKDRICHECLDKATDFATRVDPRNMLALVEKVNITGVDGDFQPVFDVDSDRFGRRGFKIQGVNGSDEFVIHIQPGHEYPNDVRRRGLLHVTVTVTSYGLFSADTIQEAVDKAYAQAKVRMPVVQFDKVGNVVPTPCDDDYTHPRE